MTWRNSLPGRGEAILILAFFAFAIWVHLLIERSLRHQQEILAPTETVASATAGARLYADNDSYTWLSLAKESIATGSWRINFTHADNTPYGREVHWCSALVWLLVAAGCLRAAITQEQIYTAIENAGFFVNLFQLLVIMALWVVLMRKPLGKWATLSGLGLIVLMPDINAAFFPGRPDHQTFHFIAALGSTCLLLRGGLGWVADGDGESTAFFKPPGRRTARTCFRLAGFLAAFGLWAGATVQLALFGFTGLAMVCILAWARQESGRDKGVALSYDAGLWWQWAATGSIFTVLFYLLQYFPGDLAMRLEVIHPAYALSWAGAGWLLTVAARWMIQSTRPDPKDPRNWVALCALLAFPLLTLLGPADWHCLRDPFLRRFQSGTTEGQPFMEFHDKKVMRTLWRMFSLLPILLFALPLLTKSRRLDAHERAILLFCAIMTGGFALLAYNQVRWTMFVSTMFMLSAPIFLAALGKILQPKRWQSLAVVLVYAATIAPFAWATCADIRGRLRGTAVDAGLLYSIWPHRIATALREAMPDDELRVMSRPEFASGLYYFGGIESVGSVFWQNKAGLADSKEFFLATDPEKARDIVLRREVDFVAVYQLENPDFFLRLEHGGILPPPSPCLLLDLATQEPPSFEWLELDERLSGLANPGTGSTMEQRILANIFRVREPASPKP